MFSTNDEIDPDFGKALRDSLSNGIEVFAYYSVFDGRIVIKEKL